jgi:prepilin peptidase CpaA
MQRSSGGAWIAVAVIFTILDTAVQLTFVFCVCYAIISDFRTLLIPNWISVTLVAAFAVFAAMHLKADALPGHLMTMGILLVLSICFFVAGWIGGGDAKFLSAMALWMGPEYVAPFAMLMALLGAVLALSLIFLGRYGVLIGQPVREFWLTKRLLELATIRECPYGVAIGLAGLVVSTQVFAHAVSLR